MKFFEPDGGTATPEAQQWLGIALIVLSVILLVTDLSTGPKLDIVFPLVFLPYGAYLVRVARKRKRNRQ
jgi:hypothetical protein